MREEGWGTIFFSISRKMGHGGRKGEVTRGSGAYNYKLSILL